MQEGNKENSEIQWAWWTAAVVIIPLATFCLGMYCRSLTVGRDARRPAPEAAVEEYSSAIMFPEWSNSVHVLERDMVDKLWVVSSNGSWYVRYKGDSGEFIPFWTSDISFKSPSEARNLFPLNMDWKIKVALADALK